MKDDGWGRARGGNEATVKDGLPGATDGARKHLPSAFSFWEIAFPLLAVTDETLRTQLYNVN